MRGWLYNLCVRQFRGVIMKLTWRQTAFSIIGFQFVFGFVVLYLRPGIQRGYHTQPCIRDTKVDQQMTEGTVMVASVSHQEAVLKQRAETIREQCQKLSRTRYWSTLAPEGSLFSYKNVNYCATFKVGCTYWIRAFRFLSKDYHEKNGPVRKPSDIDRIQVHHYRIQNLVVSTTNQPFGQMLMSTGVSFMFSREPFARLWSAYIDKFLLPDFWKWDAVGIAKIIRPHNQTRNATCISDVTFEEFLLSIIRVPVQHLNPHWKPIHWICSPCHANFDIIGKQETFSADRNYIIEKYGLHAIKEDSNATSRVRDEIEMLAKYNIALTESNSKCFKVLQIANRLWKAFQLNGYIHKSIPFPVDEFVDKGRPLNTFLDIAFHKIDSQSPAQKRDLRSQKYSLMAEAYKRIPGWIKQMLKTIYKYDFELFQYDSDPDFL